MRIFTVELFKLNKIVLNCMKNEKFKHGLNCMKNEKFKHGHESRIK